MTRRTSVIPPQPKIETERVPVEWLNEIALREGNSKKPIYCIHKWWARRLGSVFRTLLILAMTPSRKRTDCVATDFYSRHDFTHLTVLDPFMGGGTSIVEASKCGARTIGVDIDPVAWFTTKKQIEPCPISAVQEGLCDLEEAVGHEIQSYYMTRTPDGEPARVIYYFWVDLLMCQQCGLQLELHPHYQLCRDRKNAQQTVFCKTCHSITTIPLSEHSLKCGECGTVTEVKSGTIRLGRFTCPHCRHSGLLVQAIASAGPLRKRLLAVEYEVEDGEGGVSRVYKPPDAFDVGLFAEARRTFEEVKSELPFPREEIPVEGRSDPRPVSHGYRYYHDLFNARQLLCLSLLYREITKIKDDQVREYLLIAFSDSLSSNNMLCRYAFDYRKLTPLFGLHAFSYVTRPVENTVWGGTKRYGRGTFVRCVQKMLRGKRYAESPYELSYEQARAKRVFTGEKVTVTVTATPEEWYDGLAQSLLLNCSSTDLQDLRDRSVDLILTDPPYYDNLSYSELSDFFYVWIRDHLGSDEVHTGARSTPYRRALYVMGNDDASHQRFIADLTAVFAHCRRLLKPSGLMVFTFHHRRVEAWDALASALLVAGFAVTNVFPVRSEGKSGFHSAAGTIKWDCVLVCRSKEQDAGGRSLSAQSFLRSLKARHRRWVRRVTDAGLDFGWADWVSLGYALAVEQAMARAESTNDATLLLRKAAELFAMELSPASRQPGDRTAAFDGPHQLPGSRRS